MQTGTRHKGNIATIKRKKRSSFRRKFV